MCVFDRDGKLHLMALVAMGSLLLPLPGASALAQEVQAGVDLFQTDPGTSFQDFSSVPIPADFFGPGSDPFHGVIAVEGNPQPTTLCPNDDLSGVDTLVERLDPALVPNVGDTDVIDIEIVSLSLRSVAPIVVTENGGQNPQPWDVEVDLSSVPQQQGSMTVRHLNPAGGTFDSVLPVIPRFTFVRQSDHQTLVLDLGLEAIPPLDFQANGVPWIYSNPPAGSCTSNFCVNPGDLTIEQAILAEHGVLSVCPEAPTPVPVTPPWMLIALAGLIVTFGVLLMRRRYQTV